MTVVGLPAFAYITRYGINYECGYKNKKAYVVGGDGTDGAAVILDSVTDKGVKCSVEEIRNMGQSVKSVVFGNNIKSVGERAFASCYYLKSLTIDKVLRSFGPFAFDQTEHIDQVHISDLTAWCNITFSYKEPQRFDPREDAAHPFYWSREEKRYLYLGDQPIIDCVIPEGVKEIKKFCFYKCNTLNSVTFPSSVTSIGDYSFAGCGLSWVRFLGETPPEWDLRGCRESCRIYVPSSAVDVYKSKWPGKNIIGFEDLKSLDFTLEQPGTLADKIMELPSSDIPLIASIKISGDMNGTDFRALNKLTYVTELDLADANIVSGGYYYDSGSTKYEIKPDTLQNGQFWGLSGLKNLILPNSLKAIGEYALAWSSLSSVTIPGAVTEIGESAFEGCAVLRSVTIPESVTKIGAGAFKECSVLESVSIPGRVSSIGDNTFYKCSALTSVSMPEDVISIGENAFYGCRALQSISIPDAVTSIGNNAFYQCEMLASISIPDAVTSIGNNAFFGCYNLSSITFPDAVTTIGDEAFSGCEGLKSVTFGNSVSYIGIRAFNECSNLKSVIIPAAVTTIKEGTFAYCESLTSLSLPENLTEINREAFMGCSSLASLTIPNSVTRIGADSFSGCSGLRSVAIGSSATIIGGAAFEGCDNLEKVYSLNTTPPSISSTGSFSNYDATLYVPIGSKAEYWLDKYWSQFNKIEEVDPAGVEDVETEDAMLPTEYYDLRGVRVAVVAAGEKPSGLAPGVYVTRRGGKTAKVIIR